MFFIVFTMYFSGGTIPIYLNVKEFGMLDSMWSLIIPGLISTFNVIILKNFFSSLPYELVEAASIDGATDFQVLTRIFLPLSFSSLATLSLFYAVGKWNSFNDALYYITSRDLQPLQLKLYNLIKGSQSVEVAVAEGSSNDLSTSVSESIQSATIIFATLPILIVYPFVQRYFVAGVTMAQSRLISTRSKTMTFAQHRLLPPAFCSARAYLQYASLHSALPERKICYARCHVLESN